MKKLILIAAGLSISFVGMAQKRNISTAIMALNNDEYDDAKKAIDEAVINESTKDDPKAWMTRGDVYLKLMEKNKMDQAQALGEAAKSYMKVAELKPDYNREELDPRLIGIASGYYNAGIGAYNNKQYDAAVTAFKMPVDIHNLGGGKRFAGNKGFDTTSARAELYGAYSAFYADKFDAAEMGLRSVKNNPIVKEANVYFMLMEIARKKNDDVAYKNTLDEARKAFPDNDNLRREELNYYIKAGKGEELRAKLEEGIAAEKDNAVKAELLFNLGNLYVGQAFPKDGEGKSLAKPANYDELVGKAQTAYASAIAIDGNRAEYQYNMGVLYFNQATEFNNKMNAITGNSAADLKKYDALKEERAGMFNKAVPYMEKAYTVVNGNSSASADERQTALSAADALYKIYMTLDQQPRIDEWKKKKDAIH